MELRWSDGARVCVRPFAGYREVAERAPPSTAEALLGPLRLAFVVACFVSWTTSGRLLLPHIVLAPLSWAFVPVIQIAALWATARLFRVAVPWRTQWQLYFHGHMPWYAVALLLSLLCLLPVGTWPAYRALIASGVLGWLATLAAGWCALLSLGCFAALVPGSRRRAAAATSTFYAVQIGLGVAYYAATEQIQPILGAIP